MPKKILKVKAVDSIYNPSYPSYEDKNPLLYPETRPYPFSHRFINWAAKGGLASILLIGGHSASAQSDTDSLYNTFPLENAGVPFVPAMFGTGNPERLRSEDAKKIILQAFRESGIELEKNVRLSDRPDVPLTGYSHKDNIGFVYMDYNNMDYSFKKTFLGKDERGMDLKKATKKWEEKIEREFKRFLKDKLKYISGMDGKMTYGSYLRFTQILKIISPEKKSKRKFREAYLYFDLRKLEENYKGRGDIREELIVNVEKRFGPSLKTFLLQESINRMSSNHDRSQEFKNTIEAEIQKLIELKSDTQFVKNCKTLIYFLAYNHNEYHFRNNEKYQSLKLEVMCTYPVHKWLKNMDKLDAYHDHKYLSLEEAKRIDKDNKKGKKYIAPISMRDNRMIVRSGYSITPDELKEESQQLRKEIDEHPGLFSEVRYTRKKEMEIIKSKYEPGELSPMTQERKDSILRQRKEKLNHYDSSSLGSIEEEYKAIQILTEKEKDYYRIKFYDLQQRKNLWLENNKELARMKTMRHLEDQVKIYIKWAKSQMGN